MIHEVIKSMGSSLRSSSKYGQTVVGVSKNTLHAAELVGEKKKKKMVIFSMTSMPLRNPINH